MDYQHLYVPVYIAPTVVVGEHCTLGYPKEARLAAAVAGQGASRIRGLRDTDDLRWRGSGGWRGRRWPGGLL